MRNLRLVLFVCLTVQAGQAFSQCRIDSTPVMSQAQVFAATATGGVQNFSIANRGGVVYDTESTGGMTVGFARIQANPGSTTPSGYLTFQFRQNKVLVGQASVPASVPTKFGRIYAEVEGPVNTGIAIANPNSTPATITYFFTNAAGQNLGDGSIVLEPNTQISRFLNQGPFNAGSLRGTLTFNSNVPVSVIALRGSTNERSEFLITTLPVASLPASGSGTVYMPHFADGGGWTTKVVLVNTTDQPISGSVQFSNNSGQTIALTVEGQAGTTFPYSIPARSSVRLGTSGSGSLTVGSVRVTPAPGNPAPSGLAIFSFRNAGVTVSEAGVPVLSPSTAFRMYEFECGDFQGQIQTGIAIANPSTANATVNVELTDLSGRATGMSATVTIPPGGQVAKFMKELIPSLPHPFHGVARISTTSSAGVTMVGLRGDYNSRGDFLITTAMPNNENAPVTSSEMIFPHLVDGGGYMTEFVLYSGSAGQTSSGALRFFTQDGRVLNLSIQ